MDLRLQLPVDVPVARLDCRLYEETARRELGDTCAAWLATGHMHSLSRCH